MKIEMQKLTKKNIQWLFLIVISLLFLMNPTTIYCQELFDKYGGYTPIHRQGTGFFEVGEQDGRWWFFTPEGNAFFSLGVQSITVYNIINYGENIFQNYYKNSYYNWMNDMISKLYNWNFNTIFVNSDIGYEEEKDMWGDTRFYTYSKMPFFPLVQFLVPEGLEEVVNRSGYVYEEERFPDVWSQEWVDKADRRAELWCSRLWNNPYLIGYVLANEPHFNFYPVESNINTDFTKPMWINKIWKQDPNTPAKQKLQYLLETRYLENISSFNSVYYDQLTYNLASFYDIQYLDSLILTKTDGEAFMNLIADQYFKIATNKIRKYDKNHLIISSKFCPSFGNTSVSLLHTASKYVDVIALNYYGDPDMRKLKYLEKSFDIPFIISEFCFMGADTPYNNKPWPIVENQYERGIAYENYISDIASISNFIGCEWHAMYDHGVNDKFQNWGFIDPINNQVYQEFADIVASFNTSIYDICIE